MAVANHARLDTCLNNNHGPDPFATPPRSLPSLSIPLTPGIARMLCLLENDAAIELITTITEFLFLVSLIYGLMAPPAIRVAPASYRIIGTAESTFPANWKHHHLSHACLLPATTHHRRKGCCVAAGIWYCEVLVLWIRQPLRNIDERLLFETCLICPLLTSLIHRSVPFRAQ